MMVSSLVASFPMRRSDDEDEDVVSAAVVAYLHWKCCLRRCQAGVLFDSVSNTQLQAFAWLCKGKTN